MDVSLYDNISGRDRRRQKKYCEKSGYSIRGIPLKKHTLLVRGERVSAIALMSVNVIIDITLHTGI